MWSIELPGCVMMTLLFSVYIRRRRKNAINKGWNYSFIIPDLSVSSLCPFQGVSFHLWSAYLAGLSWQTRCHWTGQRSLKHRAWLAAYSKDFCRISVIHKEVSFSFLFPSPCFTGNICRDSYRSSPVKLFRVKAEETLLQTWVQNHANTFVLTERVSLISYLLSVSVL